MKTKQQKQRKSNKNIQLGFEASPEIVARLRERAKEEDRSVANLLRRYVAAALEAKAEKTADAQEVQP